MITVLMIGYDNKHLRIIRRAWENQKYENIEVLEYINTKGKSIGACWNYLLPKAHGNWVIMTHTDCIPDYRLTDNYFRATKERAVYCGSRFPIKEPLLTDYKYKFSGSYLEKNILRIDPYLKLGLDFESSNCPYYMITGSNFFAPLDLIKEIKFDENLIACDWMMGLMLWKKGIKIKTLPQAIMYHIEHEPRVDRQTKKNSMRQFYEMERQIRHGQSISGNPEHSGSLT